MLSILKWMIRIGVSFWITSIFFHFPGIRGYERAEFNEMIYGQAWRPFVTRALFPTIVRITSQAIPPSFETTIQNKILDSKSKHISIYAKRTLRWRSPFLREYFVTFFLSIACVFLLSLIMEKIWTAMFHPSNPHGYIFSILGLLGLPACFKYYSYIYDFPTLLLYTTCILLIARQRWKWYFLMFGLSCLNKETAVLLIFVFAIYYIRCAVSERKTYWGFIIIQSLIFLVSRMTIAFVFRNNPGSTIEFHFIDHNLDILTSPWNVEKLVTWGILIALFTFQYRQKPWLLRVAAGMFVPLFLACLLFGCLDELRDYYEIYVPITALIGYSISNLMGYHVKTIAPINVFNVKCIRATVDPYIS